MFSMLSVVSLFTFLLFLVTIYLVLLQYTRFFKHTKLSAELTLNLNFYVLLFYLLCFSVSLIFVIEEYSCKLAGQALAGQALAYAIMNEPFMTTTESGLPTKYVDVPSTEPLCKGSSLPDLSMKNMDIPNHKEINGIEVNQKINSQINNASEKDSSISSPQK